MSLNFDSLVNNNVSTKNGESSGMNTTNLVQSNISRKVPYSSYSINLDATGYFEYSGTDFEFGDGTNDISFSISTWVKLDDLISNTWVSCGSNTARRYRLGTRGSGVLTFELYNQNTSSGVLKFDSTSTTPLTTGVWHNVIGSYDANNVTLKLFIDGQEVVGTLTNSGYTAMGIGSNKMNFGRFFSNGTSYTDGYISNFCFYKKTISNQEALKIYNNGITQDLNSLLAEPYTWWPLDQNSTYFNGSVLVARDIISGIDSTAINLIQSDIEGNAPGSEASGAGNNLTIADLKGNMKNSDKNAYSINMADYADGVANPANSGRSTDTPS